MMQPSAAPRRVTIVANELRGLHSAGGIGTATAFLALALARMGHVTEVMLGWRPDRSLDPHWDGVYRRAGVQISRSSPATERIDPYYFGVMHSVERALSDDPPDVVIGQDFGAPIYNALRLRRAGLGLEKTLFVVFCHGTRRYLLDSSRATTVGDLPYILAIGGLEQASVELADVVVSPSEYMLAWMRDHGWQLPARTEVIPYLTPSTATGEPVPLAAPTGGSVRSLVFFGRLDEKKGLLIFTRALNALEPELLRHVELVFLGRITESWPRERVAGLLSAQTASALRGVRFETERDQQEALELLSRPGALAVMPSLWDNSPNTVYECLERGIPFLASDVGGIAELVAPEERTRVLFAPTAGGVEESLRRSLGGEPPGRVRPSFAPDTSYRRWNEIVHLAPAASARNDADASAYTILRNEGDVLADTLLPMLVQAAGATGADVITCATHGEGTLHFFSGEPRGLEVLANDYGTVALARTALLDGASFREGVRDSAWPLLTSLRLAGARVVSVPAPLVTQAAAPGSLARDAPDALLVVEIVERVLPAPLGGLARLVAGLAAEQARKPRAQPQANPLRRALRRLRRARSAVQARAPHRRRRRNCAPTMP
jgi:glycosyltransferase involved in cell wall biosynthesis